MTAVKTPTTAISLITQVSSTISRFLLRPHLLDVVQEFTTWCGMEINVKKTFLLVIDKDRKRRESIPAPDLRINGERLKTLDINDVCHLGTGNGDMSATREVVREKARVARDLIKSHPLMQELSAELFA